MQVQASVPHVPRLVWALLGLTVMNWLLYLPFIQFSWPGIYPLATLYSQIFSMPVALLILILLRIWLWVAMTCALCILLLCFTRKRRYRRILISILTVPLVAVAIFPAAATCVHWQRLDLAPWGKSYRVAYSALASDNTYGTGILFECERTGLLCSQVKSFSDFFGGSSQLKLQYDPQPDRLTLSRINNSSTLYQRTRDEVICDGPSTFDPDCEVSP
jgi:hypothetical protein